MKYLFYLGHPAHFHLFKNIINNLKKNDHQIFIAIQSKDVLEYLISSEEYNYVNISITKRRKNFLSLIIRTVKKDLKLLKICRAFKPNLLISSAPEITHVGRILGIESLLVFEDDLKSVPLYAFFGAPFASTLLTPSSCVVENWSRKHVYYNGYHELAYLHNAHFKPNDSIYDILNIKRCERFVIMRFVSWFASHDYGQSGFCIDLKEKIVQELSKYARVFISAEDYLPPSLKKFQIEIPPERMHDALAFANLYVGEGATMASECAMLGTPAVYVNSISAGTLEEQEKYGLIYIFKDSQGVNEKVTEMIKIINLKEEWQKRRKKMLADKIDVTSFMVWFVENFPESVKIMKENPDSQMQFK